ncbi:hypothetical protein MYX77_11295, partial [Acidobacteriia bacterium AH_259_A11_L15]|nr:hypothetical protein [Acidobacteriia bacterium AH_259_A11_L15]
MLVAFKKRLLELDLNQVGVASAVNMSPFRLSRIVQERVRPCAAERRRLANFLKVAESTVFPFVLRRWTSRRRATTEPRAAAKK